MPPGDRGGWNGRRGTQRGWWVQMETGQVQRDNGAKRRGKEGTDGDGDGNLQLGRRGAPGGWKDGGGTENGRPARGRSEGQRETQPRSLSSAEGQGPGPGDRPDERGPGLRDKDGDTTTGKPRPGPGDEPDGRGPGFGDEGFGDEDGRPGPGPETGTRRAGTPGPLGPTGRGARSLRPRTSQPDSSGARQPAPYIPLLKIACETASQSEPAEVRILPMAKAVMGEARSRQAGPR